MVSTVAASSDNVFGPQVSASVRSFDFTLLFEDCILSLVPSLLLILVAAPRFLYLYGTRRKVIWPELRIVKTCTLVLFFSLQVAVLSLWTLPSSPRSSISIVSAAFGVVEAIGIGSLSTVEHNHSAHPSTILSIYLLFSTVFGAARSRTLWLIRSDLKLSLVFTLSTSVKAILLVLESKEKRRHLQHDIVDCTAEATSGIYSRITFWWLNPLLVKGFKSKISVDDLSHVSVHLQRKSSLLDVEANAKKDPIKAQSNSTGIMENTFKAALKPLLLAIPPRICLIGFTFSQPFLQTTIINYLSEPVTSSALEIGNGCIGAYSLVFIGIAVSNSIYRYQVYRMTTQIRGYLISTIYDTVLQQESANDNQNNAMTLMSTDVEQICLTLKNLHEIWATFLELCIATYLLERQMKVACIVPLIIVLASWAASYALSAPMTRTQRLWIQATGARLDFTNSMISHIEEVKMSGLASIFSSTIQNLRNIEISKSEKYRVILSWTATLSTATLILTPFLTFAFYVAIDSNSQHGQLRVAQAFSSLTIIGLLTSSMSGVIQTTPKILATRSFFKRIDQFLRSSRHVDQRTTPSSSIGIHSNAINTPDAECQDPCQSTILEIKGNKNPIVISIKDGQFGYDANKAPILRQIDLQIEAQSVIMVTGRIGCGKSTFLKAILGETALCTGEIQVKSSSIAYCSQDPWLPNRSVLRTIIGVSDLDEDWFLNVVEACSLTDDLRLFSHNRDTLIGTRGMNLSGGQRQRVALARAVYSRRKILLLDDIFSGMDSRTQDQIAVRLFGDKGLLRRLDVTTVLTTHQVDILRYSNKIFAITQQGTIVPMTKPDVLSSTNIYDDGCLQTEVLKGSSTQDAYDDIQDHAQSTTSGGGESTHIRDRDVYWYYISMAGYMNTVIFLVFIGACQGSNNFQSWWLKWWSQLHFASLTTGSYLGIYALISGFALVSVFTAAWQLIVRMITCSGSHLHQTLLDTITHASISIFSTSGIGEIGNRFSQDIQIVDMDFSTGVFNTASGTFSVIAKLLIIAIATSYMAIAVPIIILGAFCIQKYYLRTSRQVRLLEIEAKSPLYTHFLESVEGILSIRAFGWVDKFQEQSLEILKTSQAAYYTLQCVQCWLSVVLDLVMAVLVVLLVIIAVKTKRGNTADAASMGVALTNVMTFSQVLMNLVTSWTQMETSLAAIARIKSFAEETKLEKTTSKFTQLPPGWPSVGHIEIKNLTAKYQHSPRLVLQHISLIIPGCKKVAICGRSGSGKSSLILCLLNLIDITHGSLKIDGIDIGQLKKEDLRQRLTVVPQHSLLLPGSVRFNVDPEARYGDEEIIECLEKVQLWTVFSENGGLSFKLDSAALSQGQKQLLCLARAMLSCRGQKLLILDEATSSVDLQTEKLMVRLIEEEFTSQTVILVTHRLHAIKNYDRVVVMDAGRILEDGSPQVLLSDVNSVFYKLYHKR